MSELKRLIGVCYKTAWSVKHKLMQVMVEQEQDTVLFGRVAAVETNEKGHPLRAVFTKVSAFTREEVGEWAKRSLSVYTTVVSDGLACFRAVTEAGCTHNPTNCWKRPQEHRYSVFHTILGNLKTSISGTYHAFDFEKYGTRYLAELQYRFNQRKDLSGMLSRLIRAAATTEQASRAFSYAG